MSAIRQLPQSVVNKIAAGEVVERPASVVKELLENAVDAGATRIDVAIDRGGTELVRVADDGCGIAADDLPLAVASHATSKIASAEDLFRVGTLGFRGEALASIAEVSQLVLRSRTAGAQAAAQIEIAGGHVHAVVPASAPVGTTVEVRNLFFNTPVRRKFLRSVVTESGHAGEAFLRVALAFPQIHFAFRHNDRTVYDLAPVDDLRPRIALLFGEELAESLIAVESQDGPVRLTGFVANPSQSRANNRMQYLFLNGRAIRDRSLQHALGEAYRGLLLTGRFPVAFLRFEMPPELVDVNVHPTKLEVRFQDGGRVYSQLLATLRTRFLATDLTARGRMLEDGGAPGAPPGDDEHGESPWDVDNGLAGAEELASWAKQELAARRADGSWATAAGPPAPLAGAPFVPAADAERRFTPGASVLSRPPLELFQLDRPWPDAHVAAEGAGDDEPIPGEPFLAALDRVGADLLPATAPAWSASPERAAENSWLARRPAALQVHNRYLVTESEEGVVVIDQHALHERILYEQIREKVLSGAMETQNLLVPEPVDLAPAEAAAVLENAELVERLGIRVAPFGGDTVLVSSYPAMLANLDPAEMLRQIAAALASGGRAPQRRDLLDELLHLISCKGAIKAGDRLSPEEVDALVSARHLVQDSHHCPHGRPTALVFTREELDKQFKRT